MTAQPGLTSVRAGSARLRRRAVAAILSAGLCGAVSVLLLLTLAPPDLLTPPAAVVPLAGTGLVVASMMAAVLGAVRLAARLTPRRLAPEIEVAFRLGRGDVVTALELEAESAPGSVSLAREHVTRVAAAVGDRDFGGLFPVSAQRWGRRLRIALTCAALAGSLLVASVLTRPGSTRAAAIAISSPWRAVLPGAREPIRVDPGHAEVARGGDLVVRVTAPGRSKVRLVWRVEGEPAKAKEISLAALGAGSETIRAIVAATRYWVEDRGGATTDTFSIRPLEPLMVEELRAVLFYPSYLARGPDTLAAPLPTLAVPAGTTVELSGRANHDLSEAALAFRPLGPAFAGAGEDAGATLKPRLVERLVVNEYRFGGRLSPAASGTWSWRLRAPDAPGDPVLPEPIETLVTPDSLPRARVLFPAADTTAPEEAILPLIVEARDDIGLRTVELVSWHAWEGVVQGRIRVDRVGPLTPGDGRALLKPSLDLRDREVLPGDTVYYAVRATDANPTHAAVTSDTFRVWLPTLTDLGRARSERTEELASATEALETAAGDLERAAREEARRSTSPQERGRGARAAETGPGARAQATSEQRALQTRGEELAEELGELRARIERLRSEVRASADGDASLERQLSELAENWAEGIDDRLKSATRSLAERLDGNDPDSVREALDELAEEARGLREQLEAARGKLEWAALEQSVKASLSEASDLAARQESATDALPHDEQWSEREAGLAVEAEALAERLGDLGRRLERAGAGEAADSSRAAGESATRAAEQMRKASLLSSDEGRGVEDRETEERQRELQLPAATQEGPSGGRPRSEEQALFRGPPSGSEPSQDRSEGSAASERSGAVQRAQGAADNLQRATQALEAAGSKLAGERDDVSRNALARARAEALQLAGEEKALLDAEPRDLARGRQAALRQGLDNLARRLSEARRAGVLESPQATEQARAAARAMDTSLQRMSEGAGGAIAARAHREAAAALNELALRLLEAERSGRASSAGASGRQARERMSALAQRQGGVAQRTRALLPFEAEGRDVRPRSERLAREQARIADELEALDGDQEEWLAEPKALGREAREIADRLANGRLDPETLNRQRGLFRRMLDAGRSPGQDESDTERRESRTADSSSRFVPELDPGRLTGPRFPLPRAAALRGLPPYYRQLILRYFERLNEVDAASRGRTHGVQGPERPTENAQDGRRE